MKVLVLLLVSGCSFGFGSAYVGEHRPRHRVDVDACLTDDAGQCTDHKQIGHDERGRQFWGVVTQFPAAGVAVVDDQPTYRLEPSLEVLSGNGRLAWGVRSSLLFEGHTVATPLTGIGHLSLSDRFGIYAGAGYSPYARVGDETTYLGGRALVGAQVALTRILILSLEADSLWLDGPDGYRSTGFTTHLGFFL
jgi:hypothetical protein